LENGELFAFLHKSARNKKWKKYKDCWKNVGSAQNPIARSMLVLYLFSVQTRRRVTRKYFSSHSPISNGTTHL
jgi:hypothetical protein